MTDNKRLFLGIKQVTRAYFDALQDADKKGYLWFVYTESPERCEIYLGTRKYGETTNGSDEIIDKIISALGLTESAELPNEFKEQFGDKSVVEVVENIGSDVDDLKETTSALTNELINDEYVVAMTLSKLKEKIGLNNNFEFANDNAKFNDYDSLADALYTKNEIDKKLVGLFHFKGIFENLSELYVSGETVDGNVYQVIYRDVEIVDGQEVPIEPPVLINSEFAYKVSEEGGEWVELGPLFDEREIQELKEEVNTLNNELNEEITNRISGDTAIIEMINEYRDVTQEQIDALFGGTTKVIVYINPSYAEFIHVIPSNKYASDGDEITLTAEIETGGNYEFDGWYVNGELVSSELSYTLIFNKNDEYEAKLMSYELTFVSDDETMGTCYAILNGEQVNKITVIKGGDVTFTPVATPSEGYELDYWSDDLIDSEENTISEVNEDKEFRVFFKE